MPSDITGVSMLDGGRASFTFRPGPDLRRPGAGRRDQPRARQDPGRAARGDAGAPGDGRRDVAPAAESFTVFATQNPIEFEGTYPLPEAELDRFLVKVLVGYPEERVEQGISSGCWGASRRSSRRVTASRRCADGAGLRGCATRSGGCGSSRASSRTSPRSCARRAASPALTLGASPRGSVALLKMAQASALLDGRAYVVPDDVKELAPAVLRHRVAVAPELELEGVTRRRGARTASSRRSRRRGDRGPVAPLAGRRPRRSPAWRRSPSGGRRGGLLLPALDLAVAGRAAARRRRATRAPRDAHGDARGAGGVRSGRAAVVRYRWRHRRAAALHARGARAAARAARRRGRADAAGSGAAGRGLEEL